MSDQQKPRKVLVTGANRGLGLGFVQLWHEQGREVFALCRAPEKATQLQGLAAESGGRVQVFACDVGDPASVAAAGAALAEATDSLDLVLNNAGMYGPRAGSLAELDEDAIRQVFDINTLGPLRVTRALLPLLEKGSAPRLAHMTSLMGSIADNGSGGSWAYRISKAALNMANRNLAHELEVKGIPSVVIHPGWVATDMGGSGAPLSIRESVGAMAATLDAVTMEERGAFLDREGKPIPW